MNCIDLIQNEFLHVFPPISSKLSGLGELFCLRVGLPTSHEPGTGGRHSSTQPVSTWLTLVIIHVVINLLIYLVSHPANQVGIQPAGFLGSPQFL
jgi:hypothetical protein